VPFRLEREPALNVYRIINAGDEPVHGLTLTLHGAGLMRASIPSLLPPKHALEVTVMGHDLPRNTILVVRWFRPDGVEYLWRVSF